MSSLVWETASKKCWAHVETSTLVMRHIDLLKDVDVASVIPILSDTGPTLMVTPLEPDNLDAVRRLARLIKDKLAVEVEWTMHPVNNDWLLRLKCDTGVIIDVMTRVQAVKETPIKL